MLNALKLDVCSKMLQITITFAFSSRYAKTRTSKFHKVVRQHTEGMVGSITWILWKFTSFSSSERILKVR